jgi:hypothetical protein
MTMSSLYLLWMNIGATDNAGDPDVDALIASTLGAASLPYTSNDTDAQTLLPAGWSWGLDDQENIIAVRASDGTTCVGWPASDGQQNPVTISDAMMHCWVAVNVHLVETDDRS